MRYKFLCGHDQRHWFAAAVPGRDVSMVAGAIRDVRPQELHQHRRRMTRDAEVDVRGKVRHREHQTVRLDGGAACI